MKPKNLIEDQRTIYSLAMVLILYEIYKSDLLTSENPLILAIKVGLILLISTQLIFLYLCGLSHAECKEECKEKLSELANSAYTIGFQLSFFIFLLSILFDYMYNLFKDFSYFGTPWGIFMIILTLLIALGTIKLRKTCFEPSDDNNLFYIVIGGMTFFVIIFIISEIIQVG